jgi:hypothetical protein
MRHTASGCYPPHPHPWRWPQSLLGALPQPVDRSRTPEPSCERISRRKGGRGACCSPNFANPATCAPVWRSVEKSMIGARSSPSGLLLLPTIMLRSMHGITHCRARYRPPLWTRGQDSRHRFVSLGPFPRSGAAQVPCSIVDRNRLGGQEVGVPHCCTALTTPRASRGPNHLLRLAYAAVGR